jgi:hypothetical protein
MEESMPDETPSNLPSTSSDPFFAVAPSPATPFNIGEEYGTAKKNLPPAAIVVIALVVIATIAIVAAIMQRPRLSAGGFIGDLSYAEVPGQNTAMVMAAINISVQNRGQKPFRMQSIDAVLDTSGGQFSDDAAPIVDVDRYLTALPTLKQHALTPISREFTINPGAETRGTIVVDFPVTAEAFANRKSLKITIRAYDHPVPLVLSK